MRIDGKPGVTTTQPLGTAKRAGSGQGFSVESETTPSKTGGTGATSNLNSLDALIALQGNQDTPEHKRRKAVRRGHDLLDQLDRLKAALLGGHVPGELLGRISSLVSLHRETSTDPRLDEVVGLIELRAEVELAKLKIAVS